MSADAPTILLAGGGTAGHVFPALAVADELVARVPGLEARFVGTAERLEGRLVPEAGYELDHIEVTGLPRRPSRRLLRMPGQLDRAVRECVRVLTEHEVDAVVTFGGYVSVPAARAAARKGIPLVVHEQNSVPGLANRLCARWADRVAVSFPGSADRFTRPERCAVTGNPVRPEFLDVDVAARRPEARRAFGLAPDVDTVLVVGGSLGARTLNTAIVQAAAGWADPDRQQVLHVTGRELYDETAAHWERARSVLERPPKVRVVDFVDGMVDAFAAADVVVCRAGATTLAELTTLGLACVLVPYPHATADHQLHNARALAEISHAVVLRDDRCNGESLRHALEPWLADPAERARAADSVRAFGRPDAAGNVARLVLRALEPTGPTSPAFT